jgi:hypothetical protein
MEPITAVSIDRACPWRAHYVWTQNANVQHRRAEVVGWAATGHDLWPIRVEPTTGRGVLVGSELDEDRELLVGVLLASESWEDMPGIDEHVRAMIRADLEVDDDE